MNIGIPNDSTLLHVELAQKFIESPSVSTFIPEEESSLYPLLSTSNGTFTPCTISHPLTSGADDDSCNSTNLVHLETKAGTSSSSGSSSGIDIAVGEAAATKLFSQPGYKHLQTNIGAPQESNGYGPYGTMYVSQDAPLFVSWNWPLIRKCSFFLFVSVVLGMCAVVIAMILTIPKTCNPRTAWFRGSVIFEISPTNFQDSDKDGFRGISRHADFLASLGISAVRLNSIFQTEYINSKYPNSNENVTSLTEIAKPIGTEDELKHLIDTLHMRNISLILDLPLYPLFRFLNTTSLKQNLSNQATKEHVTLQDEFQLPSVTFDQNNMISHAIYKWTQLGIDGFYIKGLEKFQNNLNLRENIVEWKTIMGKNRVLIISESGLHNLEFSNKAEILKNVDLVDVHLNVFSGAKHMKNRIQEILSSEIIPKNNGVSIQWSIGMADIKGISQNTDIQKSIIAASLMQIMLPGTPNIFYDDRISYEFPQSELSIQERLKNNYNLSINVTRQWINSTKTPWIPLSISRKYNDFDIIRDMIKLRDYSPSIYKNAILRGSSSLPNTQIQSNGKDIVIVERSFPRRNSFISISNYGTKSVKLDLTSMYYSGAVMLGKAKNSKIYFKSFEINPTETIIVKLDK